MKRNRWVAVAACIAAVAACDSSSATKETGAASRHGGAANACATPAAKGEKAGKHLVSCLAPSVALIETADSPAGSGLVIAADGKKYVLTNLHVVDPEPKVDVVLTGDHPTHLRDVPIVGIDKTADIAVLGPITTSRPPVSLIAPRSEKGDDVYLVGYPGETEDDPEVTISSGIVSRRRDDKVFHLSYVQTDATISGGQSGGALADPDGNVIGVSGASFADDSFALALDGDDVQAAIGRILAGKGDDYWTFPAQGDDAGATSGSAHLRNSDDTLSMYLETDAATSLELTTTPPGEVGMMVSDYDTGDNVFIDSVALRKGIELSGANPDPEVIQQQIKEAGLKVGDPVAPGVFRVDLPAHSRLEVDLASLSEGERDVTWKSNLPLLTQEDDEVGIPLELGGAHRGVMDAGEREASFTVDLEAGRDYDVTVDSSASDPGVVILEPGESYDDAWSADDSDTGLYGTDVDETFTPKRSGPHTVLVENYSGYAMAYRLRIDAAEET